MVGVRPHAEFGPNFIVDLGPNLQAEFGPITVWGIRPVYKSRVRPEFGWRSGKSADLPNSAELGPTSGRRVVLPGN